MVYIDSSGVIREHAPDSRIPSQDHSAEDEKPSGICGRRLIWRLALVALALAALWTNPGRDADAFRRSVGGQRREPSAHGLPHHSGVVEVTAWNVAFATIAWEGGRRFVGAFSRWVEVPLPSGLSTLSLDTIQLPSADVDILRYTFFATYALWQVFPKEAKQHLIFSLPAVRAGRFWTLLAAQLSHARFQHLLVNLMSLSYVGSPAHKVLGRRRFVAVYFGGGGCGILASALLQQMGGGAAKILGASRSLFALSGFLAGQDQEYLHILKQALLQLIGGEVAEFLVEQNHSSLFALSGYLPVQDQAALHILEQAMSWATPCVVYVLFMYSLGSPERGEVVGHFVGAGFGFIMGRLGL